MIRAKYTVVLKSLLEDSNVKPLIDKAMSSYPMYVPVNEQIYMFIPTREELNKKILAYYKYREIGFETVGRFLDELETSLCEIMPYYYQKYKSLDVINGLDDIFGNLDIKEVFEQTSEGSSKGSVSGTNKETGEVSGETNTNSSVTSETNTNSETESFSKNVNSQTPQGNISTLNTGINEVTHADNISWNHTNGTDKGSTSGTDETTSKTTSTSNNTTNGEMSNESESERQETLSHTLTRKGNQGVNTYAHDMLEFRKLFVNIEQEIINDKRIAELFMGVY